MSSIPFMKEIIFEKPPNPAWNELKFTSELEDNQAYSNACT